LALALKRYGGYPGSGLRGAFYPTSPPPNIWSIHQRLARDQLAITPLIWDHVKPYGRFEFDMDSRIPILT
jgi:hypothetical protein